MNRIQPTALLRWIPGTTAYRHARVDRHVRRAVAWYREATWKPTSQERQEEILRDVVRRHPRPLSPPGTEIPSDAVGHSIPTDCGHVSAITATPSWLPGLVDEWTHALWRQAVPTHSVGEIRDYLTRVLEQIQRWLTDPSSAERSPRHIGTALAHEARLGPEEFGATLEIIQRLCRHLGAKHAAALDSNEPRLLAELTTGIAEGFSERIMEEQNAIYQGLQKAYSNHRQRKLTRTQQFNATFGAFGLGMGLLDPLGRIVTGNAALQAITGQSGQDVRGSYLTDLVEDLEAQRVTNAVSSVLRDRTRRDVEVRVVDRCHNRRNLTLTLHWRSDHEIHFVLDPMPTSHLSHAQLVDAACSDRAITIDRQPAIAPSPSAGTARPREQGIGSLADELSAAFKRNEMVVAFRPTVRLSDGQIIGADAILRWQHRSLGTITIDHLMAWADSIGESLPWQPILHAACTHAKQWRDMAGDAAPFVAVDLPARLAHNERLVTDIQSTLNKTGLPAHALQLGVTESMIVKDGPATLPTLAGHGIRLRLNGLGTMFARFDLLPTLTLHDIAISHIPQPRTGEDSTNPIGQDMRDCVTEALVVVSRKTHHPVTLQGVDTEIAMIHAREMGVEYGQGDQLGDLCTAEEFLTRIRRQTGHAMIGPH